MIYEGVDWIFDSTSLLFSLVVSNWLLASFLFVQIVGFILLIAQNVRNK